MAIIPTKQQKEFMSLDQKKEEKAQEILSKYNLNGLEIIDATDIKVLSILEKVNVATSITDANTSTNILHQIALQNKIIIKLLAQLLKIRL